MKTPDDNFNPACDQAAADWVLRHDRGLSAAEQDEFSQWLTADERHREAFAAQRWGWEEMDRLAGIQTTVHARPDPDLLAPVPARSRSRTNLIRLGSLGLAAAAAVAVLFFRPGPTGAAIGVTPPVFAARIEQRTLEDGSSVELNRGAEFAVKFTAKERRVELLKGEANFQVAKNRDRPFIVHAGGVEVRAVGTAFNVSLARDSVEVVVTEGRVRVDHSAAAAGGSPAAVPELGAGQRTVIALAPVAEIPVVTTLDGTEIQRRLAWQPRLLDFTDAPLADIVAEFNRRNPVNLVLEQPVVGELRLSATFRSDNVEAFVRLLESDFDLRAEQRGGDILLRKAR